MFVTLNRNLSDNELNGTIPSFSLLTICATLYDSVSKSVCNSQINRDLSLNSLTGTIPDFSLLTSLQSLYLSCIDWFSPIHRVLEHNLLSGSITSSLSNLTMLNYMYACETVYLFYQSRDLANNKLNGTIPSSLSPGLARLSHYQCVCF